MPGTNAGTGCPLTLKCGECRKHYPIRHIDVERLLGNAGFALPRQPDIASGRARKVK